MSIAGARIGMRLFAGKRAQGNAVFSYLRVPLLGMREEIKSGVCYGVFG